MTPRRLALASVLLASLLSFSAPFAAENPPPTKEERVPPERLDLKVLKVFAAKDGAAIFRAYLVKWKDQEVVVSDSLARSDYKEGDMLPVLAMNSAYPRGAEPHRLLAFVVVPAR